MLLPKPHLVSRSAFNDNTFGVPLFPDKTTLPDHATIGYVMNAVLQRIAIYARDPQRTIDFYVAHFGFIGYPDSDGGLVELVSPHGDASLLILQAAKSVKLGQIGVKLVFYVGDIERFKRESAERGLTFGATHQADGYSFANAKDPDKNSISISSRAVRSVG